MNESKTIFEEQKEEIEKRRKAKKDMIMGLMSQCVTECDKLIELYEKKDRCVSGYDNGLDFEILKTKSILKRDIRTAYTDLNFILINI